MGELPVNDRQSSRSWVRSNLDDVIRELTYLWLVRDEDALFEASKIARPAQHGDVAEGVARIECPRSLVTPQRLPATAGAARSGGVSLQHLPARRAGHRSR